MVMPDLLGCAPLLIADCPTLPARPTLPALLLRPLPLA
jgi:hypothetical protein